MRTTDTLEMTIKSRVNELFRARQDLSQQDFAVAIARGRSWMSEFLNGKRTTHDVRLIAKMARFFSVPVGFLLGESERQHDAATATLLGEWEGLNESGRGAVLHLVASLRRMRSLDPPPPGIRPTGNRR